MWLQIYFKHKFLIICTSKNCCLTPYFVSCKLLRKSCGQHETKFCWKMPTTVFFQFLPKHKFLTTCTSKYGNLTFIDFHNNPASHKGGVVDNDQTKFYWKMPTFKWLSFLQLLLKQNFLDNMHIPIWYSHTTESLITILQVVEEELQTRH